ncbi:MAG: class A beta-lactamase-related serine hydrolase [Candidatus Bathyarchaeota archaeon]|nr:class A beta-lactamase-related serine hydrolase [Candidatus Bathyarchaeota archaeon]
MGLIDSIKGPAEGFKGFLGVSVKHLDTEEAAHMNGDKLFPTASTFKVPVLLEFYRQVEQGRLALDQQIVLTEEAKVPGSGVLKELSEGMLVSLKDLLSLMMIVSDNTATDLIVEKVGMDNVNDTMKKLGLKQTKVVKYCREILFDLVGINDLPLNEMTLTRFKEASEGGDYAGSWSLGVVNNDVSTPNEMTRLLELIANGEAASSESCEAILEIMGKCQTGTYRIPKYLPQKKVTMQRKTGSLPGVRNDVGVVTLKDTGERYALSCFTMGAEDVYAAEEAIALVSQGVYEYFSGV